MYRRFITLLFLLIVVCSIKAVKVGYALSGGGARGFAHVGMLKVLEEVGIHPQYISGTSVGALIGGLYSMGYNAAQIESVFVNTNWKEVFSDDWNRNELYIGQKRWSPYGNAFFPLDDKWTPQLPQSVITGNRINLELFRILSPASGFDDYKNLPISFSCIATDLVTGELAVFDSGSLMQGIRASMSIPSILQPFPLNNTLYIDGGISQNLPGKQVKEMGADFVIGFKVNSSLRSKDKLQGLIHVLDQTINIGITNKLNEEIEYCDQILEPDLGEYSATRFGNVQEIIDAGEAYAREHIDELLELARTLNPDEVKQAAIEPVKCPEHFRISRIKSQGNQYISSSKIKQYTGLSNFSDYTIEEIVKGIDRAWNSQLFDIIYPVLYPDEDRFLLTICVKERERKYLAMNFTYDRENEFVAGGVLSLHNYIMKNSHIMLEAKLGGKYELNIDLVKNFGETYGIYYRLFPYINEKRIYFYDDDHSKTNSARSLEYGISSGIGLYARKSIVVESYGFTYSTIINREIAVSDTLDQSQTISGVGFKVYHESLDDFNFPRSGVKAFLKTSFSENKVLSDESVNKLKLELIAYKPIAKRVSVLLGTKIGSHFLKKGQSCYDPFYLGGLDKFAGFPLYEKSAPFYELFQVGIVCNPQKSFFITPKIQVISFSYEDTIFPKNSLELDGVLEIGLKTYLGPVKTALAVSEGKPVQVYLELGFNNDIFMFSRH